MKKSSSLIFHTIVFIVAQLSWFLLLGIWIYWYVTNYILLEQVDTQLSSPVNYEAINLLPFIGGIVLLVGISVGMSLIFRNLNVQLKLHKFYDNFIANVSHELKSPLSSIQLYLETLSSRDVPSEKQKEFYALMIKDSDRLKYLINTILDISALDRKAIAHNYHVYNAQDEITRIVKDSMQQFKLPESSLTIESNLDVNFVIDHNAIKILFDNLVDNAIKYSTTEPHIHIKLKKSIKKILIEFSDNGIGLPPGEQHKIFKKFHRIYNKEIPNVKGTGLGLYWAREIIKSHGGSVSAYSKGKDKGTTFRIELPIYKTSKIRYIEKLLKKTREREESRK